MPKLTQTIPALPVRDMSAAVAFYRDRLGFEVLHHDGVFAVVGRDDAVLNLWESGDDTWRERSDFAERPVCTGAETFIAGTASCRIMTDDVDELYAELGHRACSTPSRRRASRTPTSGRGSSQRSTSTETW